MDQAGRDATQDQPLGEAGADGGVHDSTWEADIGTWVILARFNYEI